MAFSTQTTVKLHYIFSKPLSPKQLSPKQPKYYVLIHGLFFGNLASWYPFFTQVLSQENYVLCYDLRGHGLSEAPHQGYRLEDHLDDLEHLLNELNLTDQNLCFIGHSYGARLALAMLKARHGSSGEKKPTLDRMYLIDPPLLMANQEDHEFLEQLKNTNINDLKSHLPNSLALLLTKEGRRLKKMLKRWTYLLQETQFLKELEGLENIDREDLALINRFGRVLFGSESGCYKAFPLLQERLDQHSDQSQLQVIQGGGHFLLNQSPQQVLDFIISAPKQISQANQNRD